jgi:xanthine dehydrogenase YagS FAD-binding subunit
VREKQSHDWPLVEASVRMRIAADGSMRDVRVALGHVAPIPWDASGAASLLEGQTPSAALFETAAEAALASATPLDGNTYKVPMARGLLREVLHRVSGVALPE